MRKTPIPMEGGRALYVEPGIRVWAKWRGSWWRGTITLVGRTRVHVSIELPDDRRRAFNTTPAMLRPRDVRLNGSDRPMPEAAAVAAAGARA